MFIIYGIGFHNRRDYSLIRFECHNCGVYGYNYTYTRTRYATLFFMPMFPMGSQKVTSECTNCGSVIQVSKRRWKKFKKKELASSIEDYRNNPSSTEHALEFIESCVAAHSRVNLERYGPDIERQFQDNEIILLELGQGYNQLCLDALTTDFYRSVIDRNPSQAMLDQSQFHLDTLRATEPPKKSRILQVLPVMILPALLGLPFLTFLFMMIHLITDASISKAYLVNGLSIPYSVSVNGENYTVRANSYLQIKGVVQGSNKVVISTDAMAFDDFNFTLENDWTDRLTSDVGILINPDKTALVLKEQAEYSNRSTQGTARDSFKLFFGQNYYVYSGIDFFMKPFPDVVKTVSHFDGDFKSRVSILHEKDPVVRYHMLKKNISKEVANKYLLNLLDADPIPEGLLILAKNELKPEQYEAAILQMIEESPIRLEAHIIYQELQKENEDSDLLNFYTRRHDSGKDSGAYAYLLSRITEDSKKKLALYKEAYAKGGARGYAAREIAFYSLVVGDTNNAERFIDEAVRRAPKNEEFRTDRMTILLANSNAEAVMIASEKAINKDPKDFDAYTIWLYSQLLEYPQKDIDSIVDELMSEIKQGGYIQRKNEEYMSVVFKINAAVFRQDIDALQTYLDRVEKGRFDFYKAILHKDIKKAFRELSKHSTEADEYDYLLLYLVADSLGDVEMAEQSLKIAIKDLFYKNPSDRRLGIWLAGSNSPTLSEVLYLNTDSKHHPLVLAALARLYPSQSIRYQQHIEKVSYQKNFQELVLKNLENDTVKRREQAQQKVY